MENSFNRTPIFQQNFFTVTNNAINNSPLVNINVDDKKISMETPSIRRDQNLNFAPTFSQRFSRNRKITPRKQVVTSSNSSTFSTPIATPPSAPIAIPPSILNYQEKKPSNVIPTESNNFTWQQNVKTVQHQQMSATQTLKDIFEKQVNQKPLNYINAPNSAPVHHIFGPSSNNPNSYMKQSLQNQPSPQLNYSMNLESNRLFQENPAGMREPILTRMQQESYKSYLQQQRQPVVPATTTTATTHELQRTNDRNRGNDINSQNLLTNHLQMKIDDVISISDDDLPDPFARRSKRDNERDANQANQQLVSEEVEKRDETTNVDLVKESSSDMTTHGDGVTPEREGETDEMNVVNKNGAKLELRLCSVVNKPNNVRELKHNSESSKVFAVYQEKLVNDVNWQKKGTNSNHGLTKKPESSNWSHRRLVNLEKSSYAEHLNDENTKDSNLKSSSLTTTSSPSSSTCSASSSPNALVIDESSTEASFVKIHSCIKCKFVYKDGEYHDSTICQNSDVFTCPECDRVFISHSKLSVHVKIHGFVLLDAKKQGSHSGVKSSQKGVNQDYSCDVCNMKLISASSLNHHKLRFHNNHQANEDKYSKEIKTWLSDLRRNKINVKTCKICKRDFTKMWNLKAHIVYTHKVLPFGKREWSEKQWKMNSKKPKFSGSNAVTKDKVENISKETDKNDKAIKTQEYLCEIDDSYQHSPFSAAEIEEWIKNLQNQHNTSNISCLFCRKNFLNLESIKAHLHDVHSVRESIAAFDNSLTSCLVPTSSISNRSFTLSSKHCDLSSAPILVLNIGTLLSHLIDGETLKAFEFESSSISSVVVRLLDQLGFSYCWFGDSNDELTSEESFDGFCRNVRTLLLACIATELRDEVNFDNESLDVVVERLLKYVGAV